MNSEKKNQKEEEIALDELDQDRNFEPVLDFESELESMRELMRYLRHPEDVKRHRLF